MVKHAVDTHFVTSKYNSNLTQAEKKKREGEGEGRRKKKKPGGGSQGNDFSEESGMICN